jgi:hypothetical protein
MHKRVSGDSEKPSQFSATPECKHEFCLPDETVLHSKKNKGCLSSEDELKYVHVKCSLKKTRVSEPFSQLDTDEDSCPVSKNEDCMFISQQDKGIEGINTTFLLFLYCFFTS